MEELHKFLPLIIITLTGPSLLQHHKNQCHYYSGRLISYSASRPVPLHPPRFQRSALLQKAVQPGLLLANHQANWVHREIKEFTFQPRKAGHTSNKYRHTWTERARTPTHARMPALHTCSDTHMHTSTCPFENTSKQLAKCNVMLNAKCIGYCYHLSEGKKKSLFVETTSETHLREKRWQKLSCMNTDTWSSEALATAGFALHSTLKELLKASTTLGPSWRFLGCSKAKKKKEPWVKMEASSTFQSLFGFH